MHPSRTVPCGALKLGKRPGSLRHGWNFFVGFAAEIGIYLMTPTTTPRPAREFLQDLIARSVRYGEFTLASGKKSDFYFDGRMVTLAAQGMPAVGRVINEMIRDDEGVTAVGGPTLGADPICTAVCVVGALEFGRAWDAFIVRKETKSHGTGKLIEGPALGPNSRVIIVEDTVTTGGSGLQAVEAVRATGATVVKLIALLDREEGAAETYAAANVPFAPVFRRSELPRPQ